MKKCKKFKKTGLNQVDFLKILISDYEKIKSKIKNKNLIGAHQLTKSQWNQVDPTKLIKWKHFIKNADSQLEVVLALRYLLNVPNDIISQAMDVPKGTVLYRIGRGLEQLSIK
ncbi:MAG: hypothetical protein IPM57_05325 [Oligoflexia bacterium]|nr:hypothetical protein [Oligoflexia bacterium]